MRYFYARVSTKQQNLARQIDAAETLDGIERTFCDKQSGKNFDRPGYLEMKSIVRQGDEVIVKSLDRLGRNKDEVKKELAEFKSKGVLVRVMDIPTTMCEFPVGQEWILDMVNNILIEVVAAIAEQERKTIRQRQAEGVAAMPVVNGKRISSKTGRSIGRPKCQIDTKLLRECATKRRNGEMTVAECCKAVGVGRSTWYVMEGSIA